MAVVWSGMASRKWRTISTSPKAVQPWLPWKHGMQLSIPSRARAPPSGWLIFRGLIAAALLDW